MEAQGYIRRWDAEKGFGFIQSAQSNSVFFHIRDYRASTPPQVGQAVAFAEIHVGGKGPRAMEVRPLGTSATAQAAPLAERPRSTSAAAAPSISPPARRSSALPPPGQRTRQRASPRQTDAAPRGAVLAYGLMLYWLGLLAWALQAHRLPLWLCGALAVVNLLTFGLYAWDKNAARQGAWRTPEQQLHLLALAGGWPAAWWTQQWLRHKSRKAEFRSMYWLTVVLHCTALSLLLLHPKGQHLLQTVLGMLR